MNLVKAIIADLKDESVGTTLKEKNRYRLTVAAICGAAAVALAFAWWPLAIVPAAVAVWKVKIVLTDK